MYANEQKINLVIDYYKAQGVEFKFLDGLMRGHPFGAFQCKRFPNYIGHAMVFVVDNVISFTTYFKFRRTISQEERQAFIDKMKQEYGNYHIDAVKTRGKIMQLEIAHKFDMNQLDNVMLDESNLVDIMKNFKAYDNVFYL